MRLCGCACILIDPWKEKPGKATQRWMVSLRKWASNHPNSCGIPIVSTNLKRSHFSSREPGRFLVTAIISNNLWDFTITGISSHYLFSPAPSLRRISQSDWWNDIGLFFCVSCTNRVRIYGVDAACVPQTRVFFTRRDPIVIYQSW